MSAEAASHIALPFYDPTTQKRGFQFAVPAASSEEGPLAGPSPSRPGIDVVIYPEDAPRMRKRQPVFRAPHRKDEGEARPPQPAWGWSGFDAGRRVLWRHVVEPTRTKGSLPLRQLSKRNIERLGGKRLVFMTPRGLSVYGAEASLFDAPHEIEVDLGQGTHPLRVGQHILALLHVGDAPPARPSGPRPLLAVEATDEAVTGDLWTAHLVSLIETTYCKPNPTED